MIDIKKVKIQKRKSIFIKLFIIFIILFYFNYLSKIVLGISFVDITLKSKLDKLGYFFTYPFEKSSCESKGGFYYKCVGVDFEMSGACGCMISGDPIPMKPVVYLYPQKLIDVSVKMVYSPGFSVTYPEYKDGWEVIADPTSKIINKYDGLEYSYLYWEGNPDSNADYDLSTGFVIKGEDTATFLREKLSEMGLIPKEYNEFIVYWLPQMKSNPYNLIHFASKSEYNDRVKMEINPEPDSVLRIFMVYKPLDNSINIKPQSFPQFIRHGFSVVEWGGSKLN